jgi:hypothetical protein
VNEPTRVMAGSEAIEALQTGVIPAYIPGWEPLWEMEDRANVRAEAEAQMDVYETDLEAEQDGWGL